MPVVCSQFQWSVDDLLGPPDAHQGASCGVFYSNLCAFDSDTILQLVDLPPGAPPPPMPPIEDLQALTVTSVMAKSGLVGLTDASIESRTHCTDNGQTQCVAVDTEQPWLMFDLGAQTDYLYSAKLFLMPPSSPPFPPATPPPASPSFPPVMPGGVGRRLSVEARWRRLDERYENRTREAVRRLQYAYNPPSAAPSTPVFNYAVPVSASGAVASAAASSGSVGSGVQVQCDVNVESGRQYTSIASATISNRILNEPDALACEGSCVHQPICNFWSWRQDSDNSGLCSLFTVVIDYIAAPAGQTWVSGSCTPTREATTFHMPGTLEIWVSRSLALFGTRAAVIDTTKLVDGETTVRLHEGSYGDMAEGRYIYLRSFDSNRELRIDGMQFFRDPHGAGRRLAQDDDKPTETPTLKEHEEKDRKADAEHKHVLPVHSWPRIYRMRNLTAFVCLNETALPVKAKEARQTAAMLWADLTEPESLVGCMDCVTHRPSNCTKWFERPHGMRRDSTEYIKKKRAQMKEQLDRDEPERRRALSEALGSSCCKTNKRTGKKECGKEHCAKAFKAQAEKRMAHVLREMHDRPDHKQKLSVPQLVSTDMVAPHLHHKKECQTEKARDGHGHLECITSSVLKHLGDKHGFSEQDIDKHLEKYGITVSQIIISQMKHSSNGGEAKKKEYMSDLKKAETAAALRREDRAKADRRKLEGESIPVTKKTRGPKASWLKKSTKLGRRLSEGEPEPAIGVEALTTSSKELRMRKKAHEEFVRNNSYAAKDILRAANRAVASNGARPVTMTGLASAAWEASIASDGSLLGRMRSVGGGIAKAGEKLSHMSTLIRNAQSEPPAPPKQKYRKLNEREEAYFKKVDDLVGHAGRGFKVPDHVEENWGWLRDSVDWPYWWGEAHRVGRVLYQRHDWVQDYAQETGSLPVGELPSEHKTGYPFLDINAPPTYLGTWLRSKFSGGRAHAPHRRLHEKRNLLEVKRAEPPDGYRRRSLIGAFMDASLNEEDPLDAAWEALHYNDHSDNHVRRLVELGTWMQTSVSDAAYNYGAKLAPLLYGPSTGQLPGPPTADSNDPLRQIGRIITYDTLLCYLYPPPSVAGGPFGDGTVIQLHYSNRACFPMIPYLPPDMVTFNEAFNLGENFEWGSLEYDAQCDSSTVKSLIGPLMGDLTTIGFLAAPYGSLLRVAEGIDSLRNLGKTGDSTLTNAQRGSAIVCALAQLGGVIWLAITILVIGFLCVFAPVGSWCCLRCYRICRGAGRRDRRREAVLDDLIADAYGDIGAAPSQKRMPVNKRKVLVSGHVLLGEEEA